MQKTHMSPNELNWDDLKFFLEVARSRKASAAARRLGVDYTTVSRRIRTLEQALGALLFEKSRGSGFVVTPEGQRLLGYAEVLESTLQTACEQVAGTGLSLSGNVRIGSTEGFGTYFVTPQICEFQRFYPAITFDVLPVPHFVSLSRREADIAIALERPERGPYICSKLCDYRLKLYATPEYLARHAPIHGVADLAGHCFNTYVDDLAFSPELLYLERVVPGAISTLRSTSVIAQYQATLQGRALAILPCFMAAPDSRLVEVLPDELAITRHFWMFYREDLARLKRITLVARYLRACAEQNRGLLMGETSRMTFCESAPD
ncbi:LysR family transcriptional regulator [Stutzerimonas nosocomialis]|uniref:LysR family transcriptional regulator n=1 Tax=Stutzerimonas nosocomialis TaxID=1056496 RepID=A0A5R9Q9Q6_9GAMM|nr:LysR family transcriptional regulator [Stutzerimonas nosocomialis]TLX61542.1 LysR family transcriptional regulator [Stutzerimonas nosocomialis]